MAATFVYGVDGTVSLGGKIASYVSNWTLNIGTGVVDTPNLGSSGPVRTYSKYRDFSGNVSGQYRLDPLSSATVAQEDVTVMFAKSNTCAAVMAKFVESSKSMYYGTVVFTNISRGQPADGLGTWSADWAQENGPLSWSSDTTT